VFISLKLAENIATYWICHEICSVDQNWKIETNKPGRDIFWFTLFINTYILLRRKNGLYVMMKCTFLNLRDSSEVWTTSDPCCTNVQFNEKVGVKNLLTVNMKMLRIYLVSLVQKFLNWTELDINEIIYIQSWKKFFVNSKLFKRFVFLSYLIKCRVGFQSKNTESN